MTTRAGKAVACIIRFAVDCLTLPHTLYVYKQEVNTQEIHLTIKERLWLSAYQRHFFLDHPRWLWEFLDDTLVNQPDSLQGDVE